MTQLPIFPGRPVALLLCDEHAKVLRMNEAARQTLAAGEVLLLREDASLAVLSHGTGLLALRSAVRAAARYGAAQVLTLRHGPAQLQVSVAPMPGHDGPWPWALLALGQGADATPHALADLLAGWHDKPLAQTAGF